MPPDDVPPLRTVLVVEDESLVLFNLEDILAELGISVMGPAMRLKQALALAAGEPRPDAAILDVNLGGELVFDVAETLASRGVPIVFATGYGREGLPPEWRSRPVLLKPYTGEHVAAALAEIARTDHPLPG